MDPVVDVVAVADRNADLAGGLAGLAFTVLLLYLGIQKRRHLAVHSGVAVALCSAFVALIMCAINYGTLTGSPKTSPQAIVLMAVHVPVFGMSIILLMYAMALASIDSKLMVGAIKLFAVLVVWIGPLVVMANIMLALHDIHTARCAVRCREPSFAPVYMAVVLCAIICGYGAVLLVWLYRKSNRTGMTAERYGRVGWLVVWSTVADFCIHAFYTLRGFYFWPNNLTQILTVTCIAMILLAFMTLCAWALPKIGRR